MLFSRRLDLRPVLRQRSCLLLGPRQTGKSRLLRETFGDAVTFDLLDHRVFQRLSADPGRMADELAMAAPPGGLVVIDEIQKLPELLDEAHRLIESRGLRFVLTGSSARKLRRQGVNLLGGRAWVRQLHPLVRCEIGEGFDLLRALRFGTLPAVWLSDDPAEDLRAYTGTYLREEVAHEGLVRSVPAFSRFLEVAAACNGQLINKTQIASDAQVARTTLHEYFEILKDTLLAFELPPYAHTVKRKPVQTSKFYFFDAGVARALRGLPALREDTVEFGEAFEHYLCHELRTWVDTCAPGTPLAFWRSTGGHEVDFVLGERLAVEVKATRAVKGSDLRGLRALAEDAPGMRLVVVCREPVARKVGAVEILPWQQFLDALWAGAFAER
ncbi:MAG: ATP-binding protein [Deltaproteobacteria bacterium]|nr:ATP-binding protein [Deltaproteobacteria bacterium]